MYRWWIGSLGAVALLALLVGMWLPDGNAFAVAGRSQPAATPTPSGPPSPETWELAQRLLALPYVGAGGQAPTLQLLPGQLPADLPLTVPIPPGGRLVGTVVRASSNGNNVDVVLDAPGTAAQVQRFFQEQLQAQGWAPPPNFGGPGGGGFQTSVAIANRYYCHGSSGPSLMLAVYSPQNGPNDVRLNLNTSGFGPCNPPSGGVTMYPASPSPDQIPTLYPPEGVTVEVTSGAGPPPMRPLGAPGGSAFTQRGSEAVAETALSLAELEAYYAQQLAAAGWVRVDGRADGPLAWSTWSVNQGKGRGFLSVLDAAGANRRALYVRVELPAS
jgi:hypothetical protein